MWGCVMVRKRRTLPKDFSDLLVRGDLTGLQAVFEKCELEATGGYGKQTALGFVECPEELMRWLVAQGADVDGADSRGRTPLALRAQHGRIEQLALLLQLGADIERADMWGNTPLHHAAGSHRAAAVDVLIRAGADVEAGEVTGHTPLMYALGRTATNEIEQMLAVAELLIGAGAQITAGMRAEVERIGRDFEFIRDRFDEESRPAVEGALRKLYRVFSVTPVPVRHVHDGVSPIVVTGSTWQDQFQLLWDLLVPAKGAAQTVQGEVIRITGRVAREISDNGGTNWDSDYRAMLDRLPDHLNSGTPLPATAHSEAVTIAHQLRGGDGTETDLHRLAELAVQWVLLNPTPVPLSAPGYSR